MSGGAEYEPITTQDGKPSGWSTDRKHTCLKWFVVIGTVLSATWLIWRVAFRNGNADNDDSALEGTLAPISGGNEPTTVGPPLDGTPCEIQEYYLLNPSQEGAQCLFQLYAEDLAAYSPNPKEFLLSRAGLCGGGSSNFVSLGKVMLGDYNDVVDIISNTRQLRGPYLGQGLLNEDRISPYFLLALSDAGTDTEDGVSGVHEILRNYILGLLTDAQARVEADVDAQEFLQGLVDTLVENVEQVEVSSHASGGTGEDSLERELEYIRTLCESFSVRYIMKLLWDLEVDDTTVGMIVSLFLNPSTYILSIVEPTASQFLTEEQLTGIQFQFGQLATLIGESTVLEDYAPSEENFDLTKDEFAPLMAALTGIAGIIGPFNLVYNLFTQIPSDYYRKIDASSHAQIGNAVLEAARLRSPVDQINTILGEDTTLAVGGSEKVFPAGTVVAAAIGLASLNATIFPDPLTFDHTRENLRQDSLSFNARGFDNIEARSCPGKNLALEMGMSVLEAWLKLHNAQAVPAGPPVDGTPCEIQEYHLRNPTPEGALELQQWYGQDIAELGASGDKAFLLSRAGLCGGGSANFVSLGKVILGDYDDVVSVIMSTQQVRGPYLGAGQLRPDRIEPHFLLGLSDLGTDTESGASGVHKVLREYFLGLISEAKIRIESDPSGEAALQGHIDTLVAQVATAATDLEAIRSAVTFFVAKYMLKVLWNIDADDAIAGLVVSLFVNPGLYLAAIVEPSASFLLTEDQVADIAQLFTTLSGFIENSSVLDNYKPSDANFQLNKQEIARLATMMTGIAATGGGVELVWNLFTQIPADQYSLIDPTSHMELANGVLEAARLRAPVSHINIILPEDMSLFVGGSDKIFPAGTVVAAAMGLGGLDASQFPDPFTFDHTRANLLDDSLSFNARGFENTNARSCPGKNLALAMGMGVLEAWLEYLEAGLQTDGEG